ncbi:MAG: hypothetical protein HKN89_08615 [Eudoraea sp.]|nr:hypothetical protein [Eudoraea sp.]
MRREKDPKQRINAGLLMLGAGILIFRTLRMVTVEQAFDILIDWVYVLLIMEFMIDAACFMAAMRWFVLSKWKYASTALKLGATAALLHAFRVLIYVLGRTGPFENFDVKPEYRETYTFDWFWVYFAAAFSIVAVIMVFVVRYFRRKQVRSYRGS